ncbi:STAS domain-containing protein [Paracoccus aurantiacus]|uniref:STAS domain-containing protein n=1 Tax=Paracoccus aurantiacus TaxID=2599412 RepID=A0A5C6SAQ7_9RHOB|nr:STAS domain-containing protein [Paracoccus aurantiacus]TXB71112.1 STAS domain-containing protein [Paracoccus aurantiacus]
MTTNLTLPARLDLIAARPLAREIAASSGDLLLDASQVKFMGGLCLQILLAARQNCIAARRGFSVVASSVDFEDAVSLFGIAPGLLDSEATA